MSLSYEPDSVAGMSPTAAARDSWWGLASCRRRFPRRSQSEFPYRSRTQHPGEAQMIWFHRMGKIDFEALNRCRNDTEDGAAYKNEER